jgi:hypothetical protein
MNIEVTVKGITPLICNKFTDASALAATNGTRSAMTAGDKGSVEHQAESKLYTDSTGRLIIPGPNVFSCIIAGGTFHKAGKVKVTTQKSSLIPACASVEEIEIPLISEGGWHVDSRAVRNPSTGGRFLCYRPIFHDWLLTFHLELDESFMPESLLRAIVDDAGKRIGLGDFRPSCKGPFGKFLVNRWVKEPKL